jgi:hypothetical protein
MTLLAIEDELLRSLEGRLQEGTLDASDLEIVARCRRGCIAGSWRDWPIS